MFTNKTNGSRSFPAICVFLSKYIIIMCVALRMYCALRHANNLLSNIIMYCRTYIVMYLNMG